MVVNLDMQEVVEAMDLYLKQKGMRINRGSVVIQNFNSSYQLTSFGVEVDMVDNSPRPRMLDDEHPQRL